MPGYDEESAMPGKSAEIDAIAYNTIHEAKSQNFKACSEDPNAGGTGDEPQGNK